MDKTASTNSNPIRMGLSVQELKKELGLDKYRTIKPPILIKKDGKHLYKVAGYFYPLRPETIERLKIPPQKIQFEVDREQWHREQDEARKRQDETTDLDQYPFGREE